MVDPGLPSRLSAEAVEALTDTYARYETMAENRLFRALNQLERTQALRRGEKLSAPASLEAAVQP